MALNLSEEERNQWRKRILAGQRDQEKHHRRWFEVLSFCKGHQWVRYAGPLTRRLVTIPAPKHHQRYTVNELTQYRLTLAGELSPGDDKPQAIFRVEDAPTQDYAQQANLALDYAWDEEVDGDAVLAEATDVMVDLGTAPVRCRFDPDAGEDTGEKPHIGGMPVSVETAMQAIDQGQKVEIKPTRAGKLVWEAGLPFNILVPPGVPREKDFTWLVWKSVADLPALKEKYPGVELQPDSIRSLATMSSPQSAGDDEEGGAEDLGDHCFVYTCYQYPTRKYPKGKVVILGGTQMVPLETTDELPYRSPAGDYRPGVYFFHAIRLSDRFWSQGFMELALDPQRAINQHVTRIEQTIAKGQPVRWVEEGSVKKLPDGSAGSIAWLHPGKPSPRTDPGLAPGPWMKDAIIMQRENLARAVLPESAIGENPANVTTYSQLALLHSQARKRLSKIVAQRQRTIVHLTEDTCWDIKTKWGPQKQINLAGNEGGLRAATFNATQWPDYYKIGFARGGGKPRTQEAELKLIEDTFNAAVQAGATLMNPTGWLEWRTKSMKAGELLDLPQPPVDAQKEKAQYENQLMSQQPDVPFCIGLVDYFDNHPLHVSEHRIIQSHARITGHNDVFIAIEAHCKEHERQAMITAMQSMATPGPTTPTGTQEPAAQGSAPAPIGQPSAPSANGGQSGMPIT